MASRVLDRRAIEVEDVWHHACVRGAMVGVVHRADRVAECVDRAQAFLKGDCPHGRGRHHVRAGHEIRTVSVRAQQILVHQTHALECDALTHGVVVR